MAAPRFLALIAGRTRQVIAIVTSAGAADGEKIVATNTDGVLDDSIMGAATSGSGVLLKTLEDGTIDPSTLPTGIGADVKNMAASEALAAGDLSTSGRTPASRKRARPTPRPKARRRRDS